VADVVRYSYGPLAVIPAILSPVPGIERAFIFGSWAARYEGIAGADPNDIDVLAAVRVLKFGTTARPEGISPTRAW